MKKEVYEAARLELIEFAAEDIITTSGGDGWTDDGFSEPLLDGWSDDGFSEVIPRGGW